MAESVLRKPCLAVVTGFMLIACLLALAHADGTPFTDDRGVVVSFERSPQRIVSLLPSLTETVCALGECDRLVGVDRYSNYPASVRGLPRVGGGLDPSIEAIIALRPDVVLMAVSSRVGERLEGLGVQVVAMEAQTHADVQRVMLAIGQLLQVDNARETWRSIDAGMSAAARLLPPALQGTRVYFEVNQGPYAAGELSFIGETLARLGVANIVPAALGPFPKLNPEFVVRADPDLIMIGRRSVEGMAQRPGWQSMRAIAGEHVCAFPPDEAEMLARPGPRMAHGARIMAQCLMEKAPRGKTAQGSLPVVGAASAESSDGAVAGDLER